MPSPNSELSDIEKVLDALSFLTSIRSPEDLFEVFGLGKLPVAQKYGIFFGIGVFSVTIITVLTLLIMGGSFKRIAEQANGGTIPTAIEERITRPLLLERLLESQERMLKNYPAESVTEGFTNLTRMLMNIAPDIAKAQELTATLIEEEEGNDGNNDEKNVTKGTNQMKKSREEELKKFIPDGYEANYVKAYRKCQDKPGGTYSSVGC